MLNKKRVLGIIYESENNALKSGTIAYAKRLDAIGMQTEIIDLKAPENFQHLYKTLASGEIGFCFGLQGVGSRLKIADQNLWSVAKIPFIGLHFDHPSHAIHNHVAESPFIANLYHYKTFLNDYHSFVAPIKNQPRIAAQIPIQSGSVPQPAIPFDKREIKLLYLKSYVTLDPYTNHINSLPPKLRDGTWDRINTALKNPNLSLCELASSLFDSGNFRHPDNQVEFWAIVKAMDLYIRHKRANDFVEWLKKQNGAVIIGNGWDALKDTATKAVFKPSIDSSLVSPLYEQTQFVCNTNPYGFDMLHERTIMGLLSECCVITDTNRWTDSNLSRVETVLRFNWDQPIAEQIEPQVQNAKALANKTDYGRRIAIETFVDINNAELIVEIANRTLQFVFTSMKTN